MKGGINMETNRTGLNKIVKWRCPTCSLWVREPISNQCIGCKYGDK